MTTEEWRTESMTNQKKMKIKRHEKSKTVFNKTDSWVMYNSAELVGKRCRCVVSRSDWRQSVLSLDFTSRTGIALQRCFSLTRTHTRPSFYLITEPQNLYDVHYTWTKITVSTSAQALCYLIQDSPKLTNRCAWKQILSSVYIKKYESSLSHLASSCQA